jgi:HK97 family phage major capsid protein
MSRGYKARQEKMNKRKTLLIASLAIVGVLAVFAIGHYYGETIHHVLPQIFAVGGGGWGALTATAPVVLPEADFQRKVMDGIEGVTKKQEEFKSSQQKVLDDLDRADKEVKKALEDITNLKKTENAHAEMLAKMEKAQKLVLLNARSSFGDPIQRALANEETRAWLNGACRAAAFGKDAGQYNKIPAEMRKLIEEGTAKVKAVTGVDSGLGQATIPQDTFNEIYGTLLEYGDWSMLGVQRVGARTNIVPVGTARPVFYWIGSGTGGVGEGSAITEGSFSGSSVTLTIQTLAAYVLASRELLADSTVDMAPYILKQMAQTISFGADSAAYIGAGGANQTDAGYIGIFQAAQENTNLAATADAGNTTVDALGLQDFVRCLTTVSPIVLKRKACWFVHPQILALVALVRDKNGRPIFQTWNEVPTPGAIGSILGYPVKVVAVAPSTSAAGQPVLAFGDPDGMAVGIRSDLELATSDDINFAQNERAFRALMRLGVKMKTKAASQTLKPFAVLTTAAV